MQTYAIRNRELVHVEYSYIHGAYSCVSDKYDGAPDAEEIKTIVGWGNSGQEAIEDYLIQYYEVEK